MDKESEDYCAEADCKDKKMAKKCMMTCKMCKDGADVGGGDGGIYTLLLLLQKATYAIINFIL